MELRRTIFNSRDLKSRAMRRLFLISLILIIFIFPSEGKSEYQYKTEKKYFDFEFNERTYQLVGIKDAEYQKKFQTPAIPIVLAVADLEGKLIQSKELVSRGLIVADILGENNRFEIYNQKLKTQRELFESNLKGEIAINWTERIGLIFAPRAAVIIAKAALSGGSSIPKDVSALAISAGLKDITTDPDTYFKIAASEILKENIKNLKYIEGRISELKGRTNYNLREIEELNRTAEKAIAEGYASWEMYKEVMGSAGESIKKALISGAKQLSYELLSDADLGVKLGVKSLLTSTKVAKLIEDSGALTVFNQKYNKQMVKFESQKSDKIMQNKVERAMNLAQEIGSIPALNQTSQLPEADENPEDMFSQKESFSMADSKDNLLELSQEIEEKRTQKLKGYAHKPVSKDAMEKQSYKQEYAAYQYTVQPMPTQFPTSSDSQSEIRRYTSVEFQNLPASPLNLTQGNLYNQPLWNQVYSYQESYSQYLNLDQKTIAGPMDSYMRSLVDAFNNRDWDKFMSLSETAYRTGYFNRWSSQLPSNFDEILETGINAYHELKKDYNRDEFNQRGNEALQQFLN